MATELMEREYNTTVPLTRKDFTADQTVRWCPGCGDYAILSAVQNTLPQMDVPKENHLFVSGIGCSSRFPYYMNTYGFHTIHGRAPAIATGAKLANPNLTVWVITGDGDTLSIGGNHFIHTLRRNIDINILLFNNEVYGLTKGQYSPTSKTGLVTKSSPQGTIETPFSAGELAMGAKGTFFARTIDTNPKLMTSIFLEAAGHKGTSLVEILQNCVIFNDKTHDLITGKETRDENQLHLEHGKPMIFGKEKNKGIRLNGLKPEVVIIGKNGITENDILIHDAAENDTAMHHILISMRPPELPIALGVIRNAPRTTFNDLVNDQINQHKKSSKISNVTDVLHSGETWEV